MTPRLCPRCHSVLHSEDPGSLVYCWNCGAPQVVLSEELRDQLAQQELAAQSPEAAHTVPAPPIIDPDAVVWANALQLAALAGAVVFVLGLLALAVPPISLLSLFWILGAPIVVLGIYAARNPRTRITAGFGATLGLLTGLAICFSVTVLNVLAQLVQRFVLHRGAAMDAEMAAGLATAFAPVRAQLHTQPDAALQHYLNMLAIPEYLVSAMLFGGLIVFGLYILYAALAGSFAGLLRFRARPRAS